MPSWIPKATAGAHDVARRHGPAQGSAPAPARRDARAGALRSGAHRGRARTATFCHYSARTGKYLEAQVGSPSRQILAMARKGLRLELRTALREAVEKRAAGHPRAASRSRSTIACSSSGSRSAAARRRPGAALPDGVRRPRAACHAPRRPQLDRPLGGPTTSRAWSRSCGKRATGCSRRSRSTRPRSRS